MRQRARCYRKPFGFARRYELRTDDGRCGYTSAIHPKFHASSLRCTGKSYGRHTMRIKNSSNITHEWWYSRGKNAFLSSYLCRSRDGRRPSHGLGSSRSFWFSNPGVTNYYLYWTQYTRLLHDSDRSYETSRGYSRFYNTLWPLYLGTSRPYLSGVTK